MGIFDLKCMYQFLHDFWCFWVLGGFFGQYLISDAQKYKIPSAMAS